VSEDRSESAARHGVEAVAAYLAQLGAAPTKVLVCVMVGDATGAVVGLTPDATPESLLADAVVFTTIVAGAAGKTLTVDGGS
jgi:hypothetical protein